PGVAGAVALKGLAAAHPCTAALSVQRRSEPVRATRTLSACFDPRHRDLPLEPLDGRTAYPELSTSGSGGSDSSPRNAWSCSALRFHGRKFSCSAGTWPPLAAHA